MRAILNLLGLVGAISVTAALLAGYLAGMGMIEQKTHIGLGLLTPSIPILAFSITLFYFIATGNAVKENVGKGFASKDDYAATVEFKMKLFPWIAGSMVILMVAPLSGAALDTGKIPRYAHSITAWITLVVLWITWRQTALYLRINAELMRKIANASHVSSTGGAAKSTP